MTSTADVLATSASTPALYRLASRARRLPPNFKVGAFILLFFAIVAITGPLWAPHSPVETGTIPFGSPTWAHWFGTDILGRDVFSRVVLGTREVLYFSLSAVALSTLLGGAIGLISGYVRGWLDAILMRLIEGLISIPLLVFALLVIAALGPKRTGTYPVLVSVVVLLYAPRTARMVRAVALDLSVRDYVTVARARGESVWSIVRRELAPNAAGVLLVEFGVRAGAAPLLISTLSFLGFGARPPSPEWGLMIAENRAALGSSPVPVLAPLVALAILVIGLNLFTDGTARMLGRQARRTP